MWRALRAPSALLVGLQAARREQDSRAQPTPSTAAAPGRRGPKASAEGTGLPLTEGKEADTGVQRGPEAGAGSVRAGPQAVQWPAVSPEPRPVPGT